MSIEWGQKNRDRLILLARNPKKTWAAISRDLGVTPAAAQSQLQQITGSRSRRDLHYTGDTTVDDRQKAIQSWKAYIAAVRKAYPGVYDAG